MRRVHLAVAVVAVVLASADRPTKPIEVAANDIGSQIIILGKLGQPVGAKVTIRGHKVKAAKGDRIGFLVDSVNGHPLDRPTTTLIDRIVDWPLGTEATIGGYEYGVLKYTDIRTSSLPNGEFTPTQVLYVEFKATKLIEGKLKLDSGEKE